MRNKFIKNNERNYVMRKNNKCMIGEHVNSTFKNFKNFTCIQGLSKTIQ